MATLLAGVAIAGLAASAFGKGNTTKQKLTNKFSSVISNHTKMNSSCIAVQTSDNTINITDGPSWCGECRLYNTTYNVTYDKATGTVNGHTTRIKKDQLPSFCKKTNLTPQEVASCAWGPMLNLKTGKCDDRFKQSVVSIGPTNQDITADQIANCQLSQSDMNKATTKVKDDLTSRLKHITQSVSFDAFSKSEKVDNTTTNIKKMVDKATTIMNSSCTVKQVHENKLKSTFRSCGKITIASINQQVNAKSRAQCIIKQMASNKNLKDLETKIKTKTVSVQKDTIGDIIRAATGPLIAIAAICIAGAFVLLGGSFGGGGGGGGAGVECKGGIEATMIRWMPTILGLCVTVLAVLTLPEHGPGSSSPFWNWIDKHVPLNVTAGVIGGCSTLLMAYLAYEYGECEMPEGMPTAAAEGGNPVAEAEQAAASEGGVGEAEAAASEGGVGEAAVGAVEANPELAELALA